MRTYEHTVLITGGASGIGLALSEQFIRHGNKVIAVGRDERKLAKLQANYPEPVVIPCDIGKDDEVDMLVKRLSDEHPDLSVLVNNAGIQYNYSFLDAETSEKPERIAHEIMVNLTSPVQLTARLLPLLSSHDEAAVVNVSSGLGLAPKKSAPVYCATKAGIHLFSKALRYQLESTSVRVFEIIPPIVDTDMTKGRGRGKITPEALASEFWKYYRRDRLEVPIAKVKLLKFLQRAAPSAADRILKGN